MNIQSAKAPSLLWIAALGVVFGDIGTSPLYAFQTAVNLTGASEAVGIASLIIWTVFLVVSVKYAFIMMKKDYKGEGGVFALFSLLKASGNKRLSKGIMVTVVIFGAALLMGDGTLTPAISVLSAVQGVVTVHPGFAPYTVVATCVILVLLFWAQRFGTGSLGALFGPVMILWFLSLAVMGTRQIVLHPEVLHACDPLRGLELLKRDGWHGFVIVGAVALAVTGAEALYADLSHFGRRPILRAWYYVTFPALILNYLGQAAYVTYDPASSANASLFFLLCPVNDHCPVHLRGALVILATAATVIASQALISAVFTLVRQAKTLSLLPPFVSRHTNAVMRGQIYIPMINFLLGATCVLLVVIFKSSTSLGNAYGIAVTGAMVVTSVLWGGVMFSQAAVSRWKIAIALACLLSLDLMLFLSCLSKFLEGGYIPFIISLFAMAVMLAWYKGSTLVSGLMRAECMPTEQLGQELERGGCLRVNGTQIFVTTEARPDSAIFSIMETRRRTKTLAEHLMILMLDAEWKNSRQTLGAVSLSSHAGGLWEVRVPHGYMVDADAPAAMRAAVAASGGKLPYDPDNSVFVMAKDFISKCPPKVMPLWQKEIFSFLTRNCGFRINFLNIPPSHLNYSIRMLEIDPTPSGRTTQSAATP